MYTCAVVKQITLQRFQLQRLWVVARVSATYHAHELRCIFMKGLRYVHVEDLTSGTTATTMIAHKSHHEWPAVDLSNTLQSTQLLLDAEINLMLRSINRT